MFAGPRVVRAPGLPDRLTPRAGAGGVLFRRFRVQDRNNGELTTSCGRLKKWKVTIRPLARIVKRAASLPHLPNAWIATMLDEPAQAHQVKSVGARTVLLGVLQRVGIDGQQVGFAVGRVAVFARKHGLEYGGAIFVTIGRDCATTTTGCLDFSWGLYSRRT